MTFLAAVEADRGDPENALAHASDAVARAEECSDPVRRSYAHCHAARIHLTQGDVAGAERLVAAALDIEALVMPTIRPWALAMRAEVLVAEGKHEDGRRIAEQALATSTITGISWQQGLALRSIALAHAAHGDTARAVETLERALDVTRRTSGEGYAYHWPVALVLDTLTILTGEDPVTGRRWAEALLEHTAPIGMEAFAARARERLASAMERDA